MAQVIQSGKRGRKREQLRTTVTELCSKLSKPGNPVSVTVEVNPPKTAKGKPETVTFEIPKGAVIVPVELTRPKNDGNAREQIKWGVKDAGKSATIASQRIRDDNGEEFALFYLVEKS